MSPRLYLLDYFPVFPSINLKEKRIFVCFGEKKTEIFLPGICKIVKISIFLDKKSGIFLSETCKKLQMAKLLPFL